MDGAGKWPLPVPSCCFPGPGWKTVTLDFEGWISEIEEGTRPGVTTGRTSRNRIARRSFAVRAMDGIVEGWPEEIGWGGSAGANGTFPRKDTQTRAPCGLKPSALASPRPRSWTPHWSVHRTNAPQIPFRHLFFLDFLSALGLMLASDSPGEVVGRADITDQPVLALAIPPGHQRLTTAANPTTRVTGIRPIAVIDRERDSSGPPADDQVMPAVKAHGQRRR